MSGGCAAVPMVMRRPSILDHEGGRLRLPAEEDAPAGLRHQVAAPGGHGARVPGEARIRYLDADFQILSPGTFVRCVVTGQSIPLDELKYWSVSRQEAYVDAQAALARYQECGEAP